jgi:hypothetical protein
MVQKEIDRPQDKENKKKLEQEEIEEKNKE